MIDSGTFPIIIDGKERGSLSVRRNGLFTVFEGECEDTGDVLKLSVYGGNAEGVLGTMMPHGRRLRICRRLSKAAMSLFPESIDFAGPSGLPPLSFQDEESATEDDCPEDTEDIPEEPRTLWRPVPNPWSFVFSISHKKALCGIRNALISRENGILKLAVPVKEAVSMELPELCVPAERRIIDEKAYVVFEIKNGKLF